ncbi:ABC transporter ATP-binding protein [Cohnella terricola]|uniref:Dipeptide ABC transporter ATP-binding protein n=1 Tax=Cohnella terricola TaxID=1289167 RepID=A0A559JWH5_9BACL|nr:dipeptide ABC transporter ATP-binding protein [Cohnella terricola]TVY04238.1 dipeptide ABC transporter ATP-binding protein [Cohnella terricola]
MSEWLEVNDLKTYYPVKKGLFGRTSETIKAVDGVSFAVRKGETFGLVGESGCGKSTTGRSILRLAEPTGGTVLFEGQDIMKLGKEELRRQRRHMQMVFQDPLSSLNPRHTVGKLLEEPLIVHGLGNSSERKRSVREMLEIVGLPAGFASRYPHQFSGGQRQRIGIARALIVRPKLIVADEPVSALDVSIQSQVINLMQDLQRDFGLTYLFISHDLGVVRHISDRVGVMYLGRLVEVADKQDLFSRPLHPYTQALLSAIPNANPDAKRERIVLGGDLPSAAQAPSGCAFHTRCPYAMELCSKVMPRMVERERGHVVACHLDQTGNEAIRC